ncbi:transporter [Bacteroidia bacterium]|nr:transporter [Bacteroidia bacterium]
MQQQNTPFRFMSFKEWVPNSCRFWIYMLFLACFQFSNGMYFTAMSQMAGSLAITPNDVKMMSHAMLIGLTMYFPLAFRLKFRFTNRTCLITAALTLIMCNLIVPHVHSTPVLVLLCFVAGFARLFGTFECLSSVLPKVAPTHNYAVFLSMVFFIVLGVVNVFDIASTHIIYHYNWHYVHLLAIGLLLVVILCAYTLMRPFRPMPKMPLYGVDWLGLVLWSTFILALIFVVQYGNQLNWLDSAYIRAALGVAMLALAFNIWRMFNVRHPLLEVEAFKSKNLLNLLLVFLLMGILLTTKTVLQNTFTGAILHFDTLNTASLKWFEFLGMAVGAVFAWFALARLKWSKKLITFIGMSFIVLYTAMMYFLMSPAANIEKLYLPLVCCGFGQVVIFITLTVYAQATAHFRNYFQVICILGFIRTGIASPIGDAIYTRAMSGVLSKHLALLGENAVQSALPMVNTLQELFGYSVILGVITLIILAASRFKRQIGMPIPTIVRMYKLTVNMLKAPRTTIFDKILTVQ